MALPFVPLPGTVKVELVYIYLGQRVENVYYVVSGGTRDVADLTRLGAKILAWWSTSLRGYIGTGASLQLIQLTDMHVANGAGIVYTTGLPLAGTAGGTALPGNVTVAVRHITGLTGRSYRGRTYFVGLTAGNISGNQLIAGLVTGLTTAYNALRTALVGGGTVDTFVVASRVANGLPRITGVVTPVTSSSVEGNLDSQRRRLTGPGRGT